MARSRMARGMSKAWDEAIGGKYGHPAGETTVHHAMRPPGGSSAEVEAKSGDGKKVKKKMEYGEHHANAEKRGKAMKKCHKCGKKHTGRCK